MDPVYSGPKVNNLHLTGVCVCVLFCTTGLMFAMYSCADKIILSVIVL